MESQPGGLTPPRPKSLFSGAASSPSPPSPIRSHPAALSAAVAASSSAGAAAWQGRPAVCRAQCRSHAPPQGSVGIGVVRRAGGRGQRGIGAPTVGGGRGASHPAGWRERRRRRRRQRRQYPPGGMPSWGWGQQNEVRELLPPPPAVGPVGSRRPPPPGPALPPLPHASAPCCAPSTQSSTSLSGQGYTLCRREGSCILILMLGSKKCSARWRRLSG